MHSFPFLRMPIRVQGLIKRARHRYFRRVQHLTPEKMRAYRRADNPLVREFANVPGLF